MKRPTLLSRVHWWPERREESIFHGAFVTALGEDSICIAGFYPGSTTLLVKNAVHHKSDPRHDLIDHLQEGVWDFIDEEESRKAAAGDTLLADLLESHKAMCKKVEALEAALEAKSDAHKALCKKIEALEAQAKSKG